VAASGCDEFLKFINHEEHEGVVAPSTLVERYGRNHILFWRIQLTAARTEISR